MNKQFEKAFNKGTLQYGFIRTELPPMAEFRAYQQLSDEAGDQLVKLISPTGKVICLGMDSTVMALLSGHAQRRGRISYINRVFCLEDEASHLYTSSKVKGGLNLMSESGIVQSHQWGLEILGETAEAADAEVVAAALKILEEAGLSRESLWLEIGDVRMGHRLMSNLETCDLKLQKKLGQWLEEKNIQVLMKEGYRALATLASSFGDFDTAIAQLKQRLVAEDIDVTDITAPLERLKAKLALYGISDVKGDFGTTNRYHYYSSFIYRIYTRDSGKLIATGGRYDHMDGSNIKGCGLSFNSENIEEVLEMNNLKRKSIWAACESDYTILWKSGSDQQSIQLAESLRNLGYSVLVQYDSEASESDVLEQNKRTSRCVVWVEEQQVRAVDCIRDTCYQGNLNSFLKREEGKAYAGSIH